MAALPSGTRPLEPGDPLQIGAYRLLGRLGAGGMGQVFLGVSRGGRHVAVKVLHADLTADQEFRARFAREVAIARTVNGFYTAPVVDADPDASPPWMVTAYIQGPSLAAAVAERGGLDEQELRGLAAALAEGLAAIHAGGLVHRDLKPANIILASDGPRIIDFGIARSVGASTMTQKGMIIGTFTYMSPEQVMGFTASPASDVFSLGSVLVFAATGHSPFEADSMQSISHRILAAQPDLASLPESLRDLVGGCLAKDRAKRPSLDELLTRLAEESAVVADDQLEALLADTPASNREAPAAQASVTAGPPPQPSSSSTLTQANEPGASTLTSGAAAGTHPGTGTQQAAGGHPRATAHPSAAARPSIPLPSSMLLATSGWTVAELAFSPDGRRLAGSSSYGTAWRVFVWDTSTGQLAGAPVDGGRGPAPRVSFSPDGQLLIVREPGAIRLLNLATRRFAALPSRGAVDTWRKVRFSPDSRLLATVQEVRRMSGFAASHIRLWDGGTLHPLAGPFKVDFVADDSSLTISPDSRWLFFGNQSQSFLGDTTAPEQALKRLKGVPGTSARSSFSADGRMLAVQRADGNSVAVLDTATQTPLTTLACDREPVRVLFSPVSPLLAIVTVSGGDEAVALWYLGGSTVVQSWPAQPARQYQVSRARLSGFALPLSDLRFSPDGAVLAAASRPRAQGRKALVRTWAADTAEPGDPLVMPGPVRLAFSPDSRFLAAGDANQAVHLLSLRRASGVTVLPGTNPVFAPAAPLLATAETAGVRVWALPE